MSHQSKARAVVTKIFSCLMPFSCLRIPSRTTGRGHASLESLGCDSFSDSSLLVTLTVLRGARVTFCRVALRWDGSDVFLTRPLGMWGEDALTAHGSACAPHVSRQAGLSDWGAGWYTPTSHMPHASGLLGATVTRPFLMNTAFMGRCKIYKEGELVRRKIGE